MYCLLYTYPASLAPHLPTSRTPAQTELVSTLDLQSSALWHSTLLIALAGLVNDSRLGRLPLHWPPVYCIQARRPPSRSLRIQLSWPHRVVATPPPPLSELLG